MNADCEGSSISSRPVINPSSSMAATSGFYCVRNFTEHNLGRSVVLNSFR